ncbi:MAG: SET domain-containing protein-lysine N-methyltransferase [Pseudomonadota bacterium]
MNNQQTGFLVQVHVEEIPGKGLGVVTDELIYKGQAVWRHLPEAFTVFDEQGFRELISYMEHDEVVFELTHMHAFEDFPGCMIRALDDGIYINHSIRPNLATNNTEPTLPSLDSNAPDYIQRVAQALRADRFSLLATRDIAIGEELTNDYNLDDECPAYFDELYALYEVDEGYLEDGS